MRKQLFVLLLTLIITGICSAQTPKQLAPIEAFRIQKEINVDAVLDEEVWQKTPITNFIQREPNNGAPASERTEVWVAYDDNAIYIGAKLYDSSPELIKAELSRRDYSAIADRFMVYIDSYHDKRSGFYFGISAAGTLFDGIIDNDDGTDSSWDGVWTGKAVLTSYGWCVEIKVPFSQLRFTEQEKYIWGINFRRDIARKNEESNLIIKPRNESGFASRFPELFGIEKISPPQRFQILPYLTGKAEYLQHAPNDPFNSGSKYTPGLGVDIKYGLTSNLTLDATINPDFGQVEVDPAVVNLSDVETYFQEKRPFFLEGSSIFRFASGGINTSSSFNWPSPTLFYSRRIGRAPRGSLSSYDYADIPSGTSILGAGKITGRVFGDWKLGVIQAVTKKTFADIDLNGNRSSVEIEPASSYTVLRLQKDFNQGMQGLGILTTNTKRFFDDSRLKDEMNSNALTVGLDGWTFLDSQREYVLTGWFAGTLLNGSRNQMINVQRNSTHYYQRPDMGPGVDSNATSLTGYAGRLFLHKMTRPIWLNASLGVISPGFDVNDFGYMYYSNIINSHFQIGYFWLEPTSFYRQILFFNAIAYSSDFSGNTTSAFYWADIMYQFTNYYSIDFNFSYSLESYSNRRTRGGPLTLNPSLFDYNYSMSSDSREPVVVELGGSGSSGKTDDAYSLFASVEYRPAPNFSFSVGPSFYKDKVNAQWVGSYSDAAALETYGRRYVFANMDQTEIAANIRLNWIISPTLSIQAYFQPLISNGNYSNYKSLRKSKSFDFDSYGTGGSTLKEIQSPTGGISYTADADGDGPAKNYSFSNPDYNYVSLRGNVVLRWEFNPGSTLYFVWTQSRSDYESTGDFQFDRSMRRLTEVKPDNIFMVKFSYWWGK